MIVPETKTNHFILQSSFHQVIVVLQRLFKRFGQMVASMLATPSGTLGGSWVSRTLFIE